MPKYSDVNFATPPQQYGAETFWTAAQNTNWMNGDVQCSFSLDLKQSFTPGSN